MCENYNCTDKEAQSMVVFRQYHENHPQTL